MKSFHLITLTVCYLLLVGFQAHNKRSVQLWKTGPLHASEIVGKTGQVWFGLYASKQGFELIESKVSVAESSTVGGLYDRFVSVNQSSNPLFLLRGVPGLKNRSIKTVFSGNQVLHPSQSLSLNLSDNNYYQLYATGQETNQTFTNYRINLSHDKKNQVIASFLRTDSDGPPKLLWAGDIDNDGKLDLLLDLTNHYNIIDITLFVSSLAQNDSLVLRAASFRRGGC